MVKMNLQFKMQAYYVCKKENYYCAKTKNFAKII